MLGAGSYTNGCEASGWGTVWEVESVKALPWQRTEQ